MAWPWLDPISPAESLIYAGLVYPLRMGTTRHPIEVIVLPDEVRASLPGLLVAQIDPDVPEPQARPLCPAVDRQVFSLLSYLNKHDIRPLWGRWLPPNAVRHLAEYLARVRACDHEVPPRSELQVPGLAFLHYLAERAGLVDTAGPKGYLKPTFLVRAWLSLSGLARQRALWDAWLEPGHLLVHSAVFVSGGREATIRFCPRTY